MAGYGKGGTIARIVGLLALIFILLFLVGPLVFSRLGLMQPNGTFALFSRMAGFGSARSAHVADPALIDLERRQKDEESLNILAFELAQREESVKERETQLAQHEQELEEKSKELEEKEKTLNQARLSYDKEEENLLATARYLSSMPPANAVGILEGMDDQDMIEQLRAVDRLAQAEGRVSLSSVWIQQMDATRASTILRKMAMRESGEEE